MPDNTDTHPVARFAVSDVPHAPFIFYECAPTFGITNDIITITLTAGRAWIGPDGQVMRDHVVVAYLRGDVKAALSLRQSLEDALLMAAPTPGDKAN